MLTTHRPPSIRVLIVVSAMSSALLSGPVQASDRQIRTGTAAAEQTIAWAPLQMSTQLHPTLATPISATPAPHKAASPSTMPATWDLTVKDVTIAKAFTRWSAIAGWKLIWDVEQDFLIDAPDTFMGSFESAIGEVLASPGIADGNTPLEVCIYSNTPPLARITRQGVQSGCR